jgi:hypothetical protein
LLQACQHTGSASSNSAHLIRYKSVSVIVVI